MCIVLSHETCGNMEQQQEKTNIVATHPEGVGAGCWGSRARILRRTFVRNMDTQPCCDAHLMESA